MAAEITLRPITADEYARMREVGILREDDRVELIAGEIRQMSPIGPLHAAIVRRLTTLLMQMLGDTTIVSVQSPVRLSDDSEPQPDIAVLKWRQDDYAHAHPTNSDVLLIIEVSDTTADYDRKEKMPRYAQAGIPEAWLIDISTQTIEQYTNPKSMRYGSVQILQPEDMLKSATVDAIVLSVESVFGLS
jgi:Uma2 family endonuclease